MVHNMSKGYNSQAAAGITACLRNGLCCLAKAAGLGYTQKSDIRGLWAQSTRQVTFRVAGPNLVCPEGECTYEILCSIFSKPVAL